MRSVAAGVDHSLAIQTDGTVHSWGSNAHGELGSGVVGGLRRYPGQVEELANVAQVDTTANSSIALRADGRV